MKVAASILSIQNNREENIQKLACTSADYIHLDIMDGYFVPPTVELLAEKEIILKTKKPLDIHFMVADVFSHIEYYQIFHPEYMTFHLEANQNTFELIKKIKRICKVGISMKPDTKLEEVIPYMNMVDLILIMSVEPGYGGQPFRMDTLEKIKALKQLRDDRGYPFVIEVDGGVNAENIALLQDCDIVVAGSYITNAEDYEQQIRNLRV